MLNLKNLDHISIVVDSIDEEKEIYTEDLGFEHKGTHTADATGDTYATLKDGDSIIELVEVSEGSPMKEGGIAENGLNHIAYRVDDIDEALEEAEKINCTIVPEDPLQVGDVKFVYLKMPGGEVLEIMEFPEGNEYSYQV